VKVSGRAFTSPPASRNGALLSIGAGTATEPVAINRGDELPTEPRRNLLDTSKDAAARMAA
jgi:hypothetical protein